MGGSLKKSSYTVGAGVVDPALIQKDLHNIHVSLAAAQQQEVPILTAGEF